MIKSGYNYWNSCATVVFVLIVISCSHANTNTQNKQKQKQKVSTNNVQDLLPDNFQAVGIVYHRFGDSRYPSTNTPVECLEQQLSYLKDNNIQTFTVSELLSRKVSEGQKVFITVDDGFKSFYQYGWPVFKKYGCKVTVFINTRTVGWPDYLSWDEIRYLHEQGVEFEAHSHAHPFFVDSPDSNLVKYFMDDLLLSEKIFQDSLNYSPKIYAYPYGEFDQQMAEVLKQKGYKFAFAQNSGVWCKKSNRFAIPRFPVAGNYVDLDTFIEKVNMSALPVHSNNDFPIFINNGERKSLTFMLDSIEKYSGINCYFNNKSSQDNLTINGDSLIVDITMPNQRRALLTFSAQDKYSNWYWWSRIFINADKK